MTVLINAVPPLSEQAKQARALSEAFETTRSLYILEAAIKDLFAGQIALSSSFGADSAVLLHMVAQIDPDLPVLFLDTQRHFMQTEQYRDDLVERLKLTNLKIVRPDEDEARAEDADNRLYARSTDACCDLRKVRPLERALRPYAAWISGRKRHQAATRAALPVVEFDATHYKVNPLARWSQDDIEAYFKLHALPEHPLVEQGYGSIGCWPCTQPSHDPDNLRAGRWAGLDKIECGIHRPIFGGDGI
jgi:phosphoadenosine phosphosulfate reductase